MKISHIETRFHFAINKFCHKANGSNSILNISNHIIRFHVFKESFESRQSLIAMLIYQSLEHSQVKAEAQE